MRSLIGLNNTRMTTMEQKLLTEQAKTALLQSQILASLRDGNYLHTALKRYNITQQEFQMWRNLDENFSSQVDEAEAEAEHVLLDRIKNDPKTWQRYAWILERKYPHRWGLRRKPEDALHDVHPDEMPEILKEAERLVHERIISKKGRK